MSDAPNGGVDAAVRIRGIYATALTRLFLDAGWTVADASGPIRRRFDADFDAVAADVTAETTSDREGIGLAARTSDPVETDDGSGGGADATVARARERLTGVARDALSWTEPLPPGTVVDGVVTETLGGGAVVDCGPRDGYLPYDAAAGYLDDGDAVRVQVRAAAPPWSDRRHDLGTTLRAATDLVTLSPDREGVAVAGGDDGAARELAGMTDLLDAEPPEGWGIEWQRAATDAELDSLGAALREATATAAALTDRRDPAGDPDPGTVRFASDAGAWVWFGRESRFALDDLRRAATTTVPGHHRIKAAAEDASLGVDLAEALCDPAPDAEFPFAAVADRLGPDPGDGVRLEHGKPDGRLIVLGEARVVDRDGDTVTVERDMTPGGTYDALGTPREAGDVATTKLREGRWWYPTTYRTETGDSKGTYVNVCTPVELFPGAVRYVDLHVDVVRHPDGRVVVVDEDELDAAVAADNVPEPLAEKALRVATSVATALRN